MAAILRTVSIVIGMLVATQVAAQITFYEREGFDGRSYSTEQQVRSFDHSGFDERASSAVVLRDQWEICDTADFRGRCIILGRAGITPWRRWA